MKSVIFSDEKCCNLNAPDGLSHYYHDAEKEKGVGCNRCFKGCFVMFWGTVTASLKTDLVLVPILALKCILKY